MKIKISVRIFNSVVFIRHYFLKCYYKIYLSAQANKHVFQIHHQVTLKIIQWVAEKKIWGFLEKNNLE